MSESMGKGSDEVPSAAARVRAGLALGLALALAACGGGTVPALELHDAETTPTFRVGDTPVPDDQVTRFEHFGAVSARTPAVPLAAGATVVFTVP